MHFNKVSLADCLIEIEQEVAPLCFTTFVTASFKHILSTFSTRNGVFTSLGDPLTLHVSVQHLEFA